MIRDRSIAYGAVESALVTWRPEDQILHSLLVALLTTVLTYQLTAIVFDLSTGLKPAGKAAGSDLGSTILAQESSLLSSAASIFRIHTLWRWRFKQCKDGNRSGAKKKKSSESAISLSVCFKFFILFSVVPILNIFAIALSLEKESVMSFRDSDFGGMALGFAGNRTVDLLEESIECKQYKTEGAKREFITASFHFCSLTFFLPESTLTNVTLSISKRYPGEISIILGTPSWRYQSFLRVDVRINEKVYRLREKISEDEGKELIGIGRRMILEGCESLDKNHTLDAPLVADVGNKWNISQALPCTPSENLGERALSSMIESITVVDTEDFELVDVEDLKFRPEPVSNSTNSDFNFVQGKDLPFLKRRRGFLSFLGLSLTVVCVIGLRVTSKFLSSNDINFGIECVVKGGLGMNYFDSGLSDPSTINLSEELCSSESDH